MAADTDTQIANDCDSGHSLDRRVSLRLDTVRRVMSLLEDIPHDCDEYTTECLKNCEACIAQHLLHELRQQANDQLTARPD